LLLGALVTVYLILGIPMKATSTPADHPVHPAIGPDRAVATLMPFWLRLQPDRVDCRHPTARHRQENGIMMGDFSIEGERRMAVERRRHPQSRADYAFGPSDDDDGTLLGAVP